MARIPAVEFDVHVGAFRPGDKLIVATRQPLDMATRDRIRQELEEQLPDVGAVIVQADALAVYRP
jgi:hypothetical protein